MFGSANPPQYTPRAAAGKTVPLQTAQSVQFVSGYASLIIGPSRAGQSWHVTRLVTSISPGVPLNAIPELLVYRNSALPSNLIDSTYDAGQATSETDFTLLEGETLVCQWSLLDSNGDPVGANQIATIVITGEINY